MHSQVKPLPEGHTERVLLIHEEGCIYFVTLHVTVLCDLRV